MTRLKLKIQSRQQINAMRSKVKTQPNLEHFQIQTQKQITKSKTKYGGGNKRYNKRQQVVGETDPGNPPPVVTKLLLRHLRHHCWIQNVFYARESNPIVRQKVQAMQLIIQHKNTAKQQIFNCSNVIFGLARIQTFFIVRQKGPLPCN